MEAIGRIVGYEESGLNDVVLQIKVKYSALEGFIIDQNTDYVLKIDKYRPKRSNNANRYYQELSTQIAYEMGISDVEYHNRVLCEMGYLWLDPDGHREFILHADTDWYMRVLKGKDHYAPLDAFQQTKNGRYRWFVRLKPTREYNTKEMSALIDYVVQDAHSLGINTLTGKELKKLKDDWQAG